MKRFCLLLFMIGWVLVYVNAQSSNIRICTEEEISSVERKKFRQVAENFLDYYYSNLLFTLNDNIVQESFIQRNMMKTFQRYKPEFMLKSPQQNQFLMASQYLQELSKQFYAENIEDMAFEISNVSFENTFKATNNLDCFVTAHYTLTLKKQDEILFSRQCTAYCYWSKSRHYDQVILMQVEPVKDVIAYSEPEYKNEKVQIVDAEEKNITSHKASKNYDYIGKYVDGVAVIRKNDKYGFIKEDGTVLIQPIYEAVGCNEYMKDNNDKATWPSYLKLVSVKKGSKWGFINQANKVIVPFIYDKVETYSYHSDKLIWVMKEGKYGCVDDKGEVIIPVIYDRKIEFYNGQPASSKLNGKWGCLNEAGEAVVPFIFPYKVDFGWDNKYAPAKKGDKYGYLNRKGEWVIPAKYDYAGAFYHERAAVKMNDKMGFIDIEGNLVIPAVYEPDVFLNWNRIIDGYEFICKGYSFQYGRAAVNKNGKWALINTNGKLVTSFNYDSFVSSGRTGWSFKVNGKQTDFFTGHYDAIEGKDTVYLDYNGNRYLTKEMRSEKSDSIMAKQGVLNAMVNLAKDYYNKDKSIALKWFEKAVKASDINFYIERAKCYYYAEDETKSYPKALELFKNAAEENEREAMYFLGWMYEHGQGCEKNISEAISWYKKADNYGESKKRLEELDKVYANGYEYVDLGLSAKWATCNLGASTPFELGDRYAWGEVNTKSSFTKKNCTTYKKKYMMDFSAWEYYDAARSNRKGLWRTPTAKEFNELIFKCKWDWTEINGKTGYKVTGPNGNSIFIPFGGNYWSSTSTDSKIGTFFGIGRWDKQYISTIERFFGHYIRPVID